MTAVQETSRAAYKDILTGISARQRAVYAVLLSKTNQTNTEIARTLGRPINTVTPRTFELRELGLVREATKRKCSITGRTAIAWEPVDREAPMPVSESEKIPTVHEV